MELKIIKYEDFKNVVAALVNSGYTVSGLYDEECFCYKIYFEYKERQWLNEQSYNGKFFNAGR